MSASDSINEKSSTVSNSSDIEKGIICRICYESAVKEKLISLCSCKGSVGQVHLRCLERWLAESNSSSCELCGTHYVMERILTHTVGESVRWWLCQRATCPRGQVRNLRKDICICVVLIPFSFALLYFCILTCDFYSQKKHVRGHYSSVPTSRWTSACLLLMVSVLVTAFFAWLFSVMSFHYDEWFASWQKEAHCRIILPIDLTECPGCSDKKKHRTGTGPFHTITVP